MIQSVKDILHDQDVNDSQYGAELAASLILASKHGHLEIVQRLCEQVADVDARTESSPDINCVVYGMLGWLRGDRTDSARDERQCQWEERG